MSLRLTALTVAFLHYVVRNSCCRLHAIARSKGGLGMIQ